MACTMLHAQKTEATGTVVDAAGEPIIGATVMEKGTPNGTVTNLDGDFKIEVRQGATLVVSYIGYGSEDVPAGQGTKVVLKEDGLYNESSG